MSRSIDFTQPGGFPFTQNILGFIQTGFQHQITQLLLAGVDGDTPTIVSGMAVTIAGGDTSVTDGWFMYHGMLHPFTGGTVTPGGGEVALVVITYTVGTLSYNDGSTPGVVSESSAALDHAVTVTDATHFPVSALRQWRVTPNHFYSAISAPVDGATILFDKHQTLRYDAFDTSGSGVNTITLDDTGAIEGAVVLISGNVNGATDVTLVASSGTVILTNGSYAFANNLHPAYVKITYYNGWDNLPVFFAEIYNP